MTNVNAVTRTRAPLGTLAAAVVLVAAVPVATWWLTGQQNAQGFAPSELDYAVRPLALGPGLETALGAVALALAGVSAGALLRASWQERFDPRWWQVVLPLLAAGMLLGVGWRILTAGVIGANIGAGFVVLLGDPAVAALVLWAVGCGLGLRFSKAAPTRTRTRPTP
ncbi:hypothetical protein [Streptomyces sp. TLI_146]|uniref:hypothetical protein n=1 Tax=Streptomyces sp. TLI_146 TaxID=1938858 RepID=UPI001180EDD8|nr:hypothetical protein [Streptomyces sp. TLI_146]